MSQRHKITACVVSALVLAVSASCRKKVPVASAPPPPAAVPAPAKPTAPTISEFTAAPDRIERGQSATLQWQVHDATEIQIDQGLGSVAASGRRSVSPDTHTTYTLTATGPGGKATANTSLTVTAPPPPPQPTPAPRVMTFSERLGLQVRDAYFDYDKYSLRPDAIQALTSDAAALKTILQEFPNTTVVLEGHCDERGSAEYNLGLGDRRASSAKEFLERVGVPPHRLIVVSYGKEQPQCTQESEACWQMNRRVHFAPGETQKQITGWNAASAGNAIP